MGKSPNYRDRQGKTLADYDRPSLAVDTAVLTLDETGSTLLVLQVRRENDAGWGLPGTFLHRGERLADAVGRSLRDKAGVPGLGPRQLHVFDDPDRDGRGWVLSVAHVVVVRLDQIITRFPDRTRLVPAARPGELRYDHPTIIRAAVEDLRARYRDAPDPDGLLPAEFTMTQLRRAHEAVLGRRLQPDNFRRAMENHIEGTDHRVSTGGPGRPAEIFRRKRRRAHHD